MYKFKWKNNKKCAVAITVNLSGEYFWLSMFPESINKPKTLSMGEFGVKVGLERLLDLFEKHDIEATFFVTGKIIEKYEKKIKLICDKNHEIANYGYENENFALLNKEEQEYSLEKTNKIIKELTGYKPRGFRAPDGEITEDTYDILEKMNFLYDSSLMDDFLPYFMKFKNKEYNIVQMPIKWQLYDFPYFAFNYSPAFPEGQGRISSYDGVLKNWIYEYEGYKKNNLLYILQLSPQTIGTPGRMIMLKEFIEYIKKNNDTWIAKSSEIVEYFKSNIELKNED